MDATEILKSIGALIFVLALIGAVAFAARRLEGFSKNLRGRVRDLSVVEQIGVDPRRRLLVVRWGKVERLLLVGGASDLLLGERPAADFATALGDAPPGGSAP